MYGEATQMADSEKVLGEMLRIIRENPGIRPSEINRLLNRQHSAYLRDKLIKQGSPFNLPDDILFIDEAAEESWTVFDHPTVRVYRKTTPMTREAYYLLLYSGN